MHTVSVPGRTSGVRAVARRGGKSAGCELVVAVVLGRGRGQGDEREGWGQGPGEGDGQTRGEGDGGGEMGLLSSCAGLCAPLQALVRLVIQ